jgi:ABC-type multidrug transport system fused ATPase/permease subunit
MQVKIDRINRVLREQITGIRVIRAFVRTRQERQCFEMANADLTSTALRVRARSSNVSSDTVIDDERWHEPPVSPCYGSVKVPGWMGEAAGSACELRAHQRTGSRAAPRHRANGAGSVDPRPTVTGPPGASLSANVRTATQLGVGGCDACARVGRLTDPASSSD